MNFQKQDLQGTHYYWTEVKHDVFTGKPSRRIFDRNNGNQVLFLINSCGTFSEKFTLQEGLEVEQRLLNELPLETKSEISVFNWIRNSEVSVK